MTDACDALIFVLPGGANEFHADYEAKPAAAWLESLGYSAQVFRYPVAPARYPEALLAVQAAIGAARTTFSGRIGVLGFSAGGHLAGQAALAQPKSWAERVDFAGLIYPVVSFGDFGHELSRKNLLGPGPTPAKVSAVSLENAVTADAPPLFIVHTVEDAAVPVQNSLRLAESLAEHGARFALHIFLADLTESVLALTPERRTTGRPCSPGGSPRPSARDPQAMASFIRPVIVQSMIWLYRDLDQTTVAI